MTVVVMVIHVYVLFFFHCFGESKSARLSIDFDQENPNSRMKEKARQTILL